MTVSRNSVFACTSVLASVVVGLAALSGCQSAGPSGPKMAPTGVEGQWMSSDGVAVSTLSGGQFTSVSAQTGEKLTTGTYASLDARTITLDFYSVKSQTNSRATCLLASSNQMNCTLGTGVQFVLVRRA